MDEYTLNPQSLLSPTTAAARSIGARYRSPDVRKAESSRSNLLLAPSQRQLALRTSHHTSVQPPNSESGSWRPANCHGYVFSVGARQGRQCATCTSMQHQLNPSRQVGAITANRPLRDDAIRLELLDVASMNMRARLVEQVAFFEIGGLHRCSRCS